jgi:hypothetical protein
MMRESPRTRSVALAVVVASTALALVAAAPSAGHARASAGHGILFVYRPHLAATVGGDIYDLLAGRGVQRLTHSTNAKFDPQWSPNGTQIAYTAMESNGLCRAGRVFRRSGSPDQTAATRIK